MKRANIQFALDTNLQGHIIKSNDETINFLCKSVGCSFNDLGMDLPAMPDKPGLYRGVVEIFGDEENMDSISLYLTSHQKEDVNNKGLMNFVGALLKQQGGQMFIEKHYLQDIHNKKLRISMEEDKKDNVYILKLEEG